MAGLLRNTHHIGGVRDGEPGVQWNAGWPAGNRAEIRETFIAPTPIMLDRLTEEAWRQALTEAIDCLDASRGRRGRAGPSWFRTRWCSGERSPMWATKSSHEPYPVRRALRGLSPSSNASAASGRAPFRSRKS